MYMANEYIYINHKPKIDNSEKEWCIDFLGEGK